MDWIEYMSAKHLLAEERVGVPTRNRQREEIAQVAETKALIRKHQGLDGPR